mmetsp:Transcript_14562/g.31698  ORF Transcript_14562/g.31698 Transcript_14562/m.31698 type:complete len:321 (-) Transcript_14562:329-1291(-)
MSSFSRRTRFRARCISFIRSLPGSFIQASFIRAFSALITMAADRSSWVCPKPRRRSCSSSLQASPHFPTHSARRDLMSFSACFTARDRSARADMLSGREAWRFRRQRRFVTRATRSRAAPQYFLRRVACFSTIWARARSQSNSCWPSNIALSRFCSRVRPSWSSPTSSSFCAAWLCPQASSLAERLRTQVPSVRAEIWKASSIFVPSLKPIDRVSAIQFEPLGFAGPAGRRTATSSARKRSPVESQMSSMASPSVRACSESASAKKDIVAAPAGSVRARCMTSFSHRSRRSWTASFASSCSRRPSFALSAAFITSHASWR